MTLPIATLVHLLSTTPLQEEPTPLLQYLYQSSAYCSMGAVAGAAYLVSHLPLTFFNQREWQLFQKLMSSMTLKLFSHITHRHTYTPFSSWESNQAQLAKISATTIEEAKLLDFLERRWLAKSTGFIPTVIDWICPLFNISIQVHPETSHCYFRLPSQGLYQTYKSRVEAWKKNLPHPHHFPLILTRPGAIQNYLPHCVEISSLDQFQTLPLKSKTVVDLTSVLSQGTPWSTCHKQLIERCRREKISLEQLVCIERVHQEEIGGIRILPLAKSSDNYLLEYISRMGLATNRVELDRWPTSASPLSQKAATQAPLFIQNFTEILHTFESTWSTTHYQQQLMVGSTLKLLRRLSQLLPRDTTSTRSAIGNLSFTKIEQQLALLSPTTPFYMAMESVEQLHANISTLLATFSPFNEVDFSPIYQKLFDLPPNLQPLTRSALHSTGMTTLAGIFQRLGASPRIIYGENTYFESIFASEECGEATPLDQASWDEWHEADLVITQFNPPLKRIDSQSTPYRVEIITAPLRQALDHRTKPLTIAIDCTIDLLDPPHLHSFLATFEKEIVEGRLNIIVFRSGHKFDLFGMDNYCGAPLLMIHNDAPQWDVFDTLLTDPVLQTDILSLNWFCLAFSTVAAELDHYRQQIFDNTAALLQQLPDRLLHDATKTYHVVPFEPNAKAAFLDIKIGGPLHKARAAMFVGGLLYQTCMEQGHPIYYRPSLGFYHPNFTIIFGESSSTIRLTLGLDPAQVDIFADCFTTIDSLND